MFIYMLYIMCEALCATLYNDTTSMRRNGKHSHKHRISFVVSQFCGGDDNIERRANCVLLKPSGV